MKKSFFKKSIALMLCCVICTTSLTAFAFTSSSLFNTKVYTHQDRFSSVKITQGIDVSYHNGTLDWAQIKNAGVEFAIIRAGYRGYAAEGKLVKDTMFDQNVAGAKAQGIPVGAYIYSQATTEAEGVQEADSILNWIQGYDFELPIVFDYEFADVASGRLDSAWKNGTLNKAKMTNIAMAFCNRIRENGYTPMVYANKTFLNTNVDHSTLDAAGIPVWLAHYTTNTNYDGEISIWQYTSTGTIPGISGKVFDCNYMYGDTLVKASDIAVSSIKNQAYTGYSVEPGVTLKYRGIDLVEGMDYTVTYADNINIGVASASVVGLGAYANLNRTLYFNILPESVTDVQVISTTKDSAQITWSPVSYATGYVIQTIKNGKWTTVAKAFENNTTVAGLICGSTNFIRVAPYVTINSKDYVADYVNYAKAITQMGTANASVSAYTNSSITLKWQKQDATNGYQIYKYNSSSKKYELIKTIENGSTSSYKVTGLSKNTKYQFKVRAYVNDGDSKKYGAFGSVVTQYTSVSKPTLKTVSTPSAKKIKMTWGKISGATGYQVMWSTYSNFSANYKTSSTTSLSKTITTAQSKKYYYVRVRAYRTISGKKIYSPWSSTKKIKTK